MPRAITIARAIRMRGPLYPMLPSRAVRPRRRQRDAGTASGLYLARVEVVFRMDTARTSVRLLMAELARAQRAIAHRDTETAQQAIAAALELDPHNVQALEWQADLREGRVSAPLRPHLAPVAAGPARPVA